MSFVPNGFTGYQNPVNNGQGAAAPQYAPGPVQQPNAGPSPAPVGQLPGPGFMPPQPAPAVPQFTPAPYQQPSYQQPTSQPSPVVPSQPMGQPAGAFPQQPFAQQQPQQPFAQPQQPGYPQQPQPAEPFGDMSDLAVQFAQQQAYAQYNAQQQQEAAAAAAAAAQQQQLAPGQQPQEPQWTVDGYFDQAWNAPQWNPQFEQAIAQGIVVKDAATGMYTSAPGMEAMAMGVLPSMNAYEQHRTAKLGEIFSDNPYKHLYQKMEEPIQRMVEDRASQIVQEELDRREQNEFVTKYEQENAAWMYQQLPNGQRVATPNGLALQQHAKTLVEQGVDLKTAIEYAETRAKPQAQPAQPQQVTASGVQTLGPDPMLNAPAPPQYAQQPQMPMPVQQPQQPFMPQPAPQPQQPQQTTLPPQQPMPTPQPAGYTPGYAPQPSQPFAPAAPTQQQPSFLETAAQRSAYGTNMSPGASPASEASTVQMSENELDNIFTTAAANAGLN